jgi:hypothetical protein
MSDSDQSPQPAPDGAPQPPGPPRRKTLSRWTAALILLGLLAGAGACIVAPVVILALISIGHIEANAPDEAHFDALLTSSLETYCRDMAGGKPVTVRYAMLRDGPTQAGLGFPKYYVWVEVFDGPSRIVQGAAKAVGIDRQTLEITDFFSEATIANLPLSLYRTFPKAVADASMARAGLPPL